MRTTYRSPQTEVPLSVTKTRRKLHHWGTEGWALKIWSDKTGLQNRQNRNVCVDEWNVSKLNSFVIYVPSSNLYDTNGPEILNSYYLCTNLGPKLHLHVLKITLFKVLQYWTINIQISNTSLVLRYGNGKLDLKPF